MSPRTVLGVVSLGYMFAAPVRAIAGYRPVERAARGGLLPVLYAEYVALQVFDGYTTTAGVQRGAVESNALMLGIADQSVSGGITGAGSQLPSGRCRTAS